MLKEFLKINNPRQQRKYLDKQAVALKKSGINEEQMNKILELSDYLDSMHFWSRYDSLFDETIKQAKSMKKEMESNQKLETISEKEKEQFNENLSVLTSYEKDIVVDGYDGNKNRFRSILIKGMAYPEKERYASIQDAKALLLEAMKYKGSLEVQYYNKRRIIKRIKL